MDTVCIICMCANSAVPRSEVLKLVQLVFVVLMSAMQDDPANRMFFETNVSKTFNINVCVYVHMYYTQHTHWLCSVKG